MAKQFYKLNDITMIIESNTEKFLKCYFSDLFCVLNKTQFLDTLHELASDIEQKSIHIFKILLD